MPELPEVETIRAQIEPRLVDRLITRAGSHPSAKFAPATGAVGHRFHSVRRRGKYLILGLHADLDTDGVRRRELVVHLGMTGRLSVSDTADLHHRHLRAWWRLDDGAVFTFTDIRRFGRVHLVDPGCYDTIATLSRIGPEPFDADFGGESLWRAVRTSSRHIKTQLLSQRPVAGVGNIYADEALWLAGINPVVRRLSRQRCEHLAEAIKVALAAGLAHGGTTLRDYVNASGDPGRNQHHLHCYGRAGEPCERCGTLLRRRVIDARSTTWCPQCQRH